MLAHVKVVRSPEQGERGKAESWPLYSAHLLHFVGDSGIGVSVNQFAVAVCKLQTFLNPKIYRKTD